MCQFKETATRLRIRFPRTLSNSSHAGTAALLKRLTEAGLLDFPGLRSELDRRDAADFQRLLANTGLTLTR
jgi:hypothetical protein